MDLRNLVSSLNAFNVLPQAHLWQVNFIRKYRRENCVLADDKTVVFSAKDPAELRYFVQIWFETGGSEWLNGPDKMIWDFERLYETEKQCRQDKWVVCFSSLNVIHIHGK